MRFRGAAALVATAALCATALAGCGDDSAKADRRAAGTPTGYTGGASPSDQSTQDQSGPSQTSSAPSSSKPSSQLSDPVAPTSIPPVVRHGKTPHPTVQARPVQLHQPVTYPDGVALRITGTAQGKVTGQNVGDVAGPTTTFSLTLDNGSTRTLDLESVVVSCLYGAPARIANPVYGTDNLDFGGKVRPGGKATARYTFMVPTSSRDAVTIRVDFDGVHTAAVFTGSSL